MDGNKEVIDWLSHRVGLRFLEVHPLPIAKFNLEDNDRGNSFTTAFGKKEFTGLAGFVDLVGYSTTVRGLSPTQIQEFLSPFLTKVYDCVSEVDGLIDKMIGDEVMFVLPNYAEDGGQSVSHLGGELLPRFRVIQSELGPKYRMRVGLAYGRLACSQFAGKTYSEWSIVGEAVHLAKRLHGLPGLKEPATIACALGMLTSEPDSDWQLQNLAQFLANMPYRIEPVQLEYMAELKGVSPARAVYLIPRE